MRLLPPAMALLLLGAAAPAYAQHDHEHEHRVGGGPPPQARGGGGPPPESREEHTHGGPQPGAPNNGAMRGQPRPAPAPPAQGGGMRGQPPPPPARNDRPAPRNNYTPPPQHPAAEARAWHSQGGWRQGAWQQHNTWQEHRSAHWQDDHRGWSQRGGYGGYYIPANRFGRQFGSNHFFHLQARPSIYDGYPRFRYGGYNFLMVDPWPDYWGDSWYQNDDLFIDYEGDGYYLHNRRYPEVGLAVTVSL